MSNPISTSLSSNNGIRNSNLKVNNAENHRKTANHLTKAARFHEDAAKYHEIGNFEKASASTIIAQGHVCCATELQREDVKNHAAKE